MLRRISALFLSLILVFTAAACTGESDNRELTSLENTALFLTYSHFNMLSLLTVKMGMYKDEKEFFEDMVFLELIDHNYGYPAYRSHDNRWDAVFQPDSTGQKVSRVQLLTAFTGVDQDTELSRKTALHVYGFCSPGWTDDPDELSRFTEKFLEIYFEAERYTGNKETRAIDFNGIKVSCYRYNATLGIIIEYARPINTDMLFENPVVDALTRSVINQSSD